MGRARSLLMGLVVAGGWGACSGSLGGAKSDAGRDGTARDGTASTDRAVDGFAGVDRYDGSADLQDGGGVCSPLDLATQCSGGDDTECQPTWTEAVAHPQCMGGPGSFIRVSESRSDCDGYHIRQIDHFDGGATYYYDIASGALVAIYLYGSGPNRGTCSG